MGSALCFPLHLWTKIQSAAAHHSVFINWVANRGEVISIQQQEPSICHSHSYQMNEWLLGMHHASPTDNRIHTHLKYKLVVELLAKNDTSFQLSQTWKMWCSSFAERTISETGSVKR